MQTIQNKLSIHEEILHERCEILKKVISNLFSKRNYSIDISPLNLSSNLGKLSHNYNLSFEEELLIIFAYASEYHPEYFLEFIEGFKQVNFRTKFGGYLEKEREFFTPTLKTFLMVCLPKKDRTEFLLKVTDKSFVLVKDGILNFNHYSKSNDNLLDRIPKISNNFIEYLLGGTAPRLDHEFDFPATLAKTKLSFDKVILPIETKEELGSLELLLKLKPQLKQRKDLKSFIKTNQIFVFTGSPGTGKSLTATTLGQKYNVPTYTLDISRVVSRYVGDFEKAM
ncbi:AAA family ATPase [Flammeovirga aprica]|uniref:AAA family ATPase n=1 Tax=Flammeovirga aprica JL-4 TaxID=694437 RepID=A0A7X9XCZ5_9BACT|nr:AAA family ATPase [Flammeovirga aprica]NME72265.1 AAA family ATPase [Flammeovirga aprica JL-4]